jgi:predicted RND superfamily exporter protein
MQALFEGKDPDKALAYSLRDRGRVTLIDVKLNAICFCFLMFCQFIPIQRLGAIMVIMMITCGFGALFLMTGVLRSCVKVRKINSLGNRLAKKMIKQEMQHNEN